MSKFTIEYRGKIIINERGAKDFLRIKKKDYLMNQNYKTP